MKFIVVQTGARRGYAVPCILEKAGMLERLYTDVAGNVGIGRWLGALRGAPLVGSSLSRLASRRIPEKIVSKTWTFDVVAIRGMIQNACGSKNPVSRFRRQIDFGETMGRSMIRSGFGNASHVFSMLNEGGPYLTEAYRRGLVVVVEVYILLATERILEQERRLFPEWEPNTPDYSTLRGRYIREDVLMEHTHIYLCPSEVVRDDLVANWGVSVERTSIVPYGVQSRWLELEPRTQAGRVLFVGTAGLRKGIHYLAMAAKILKDRGLAYEFRVAGSATEDVKAQSICEFLTFLGRVPRDRIHEEFEQADVFVLPSLAEGSAEVTYEALAAGLPLVVTKAAGSVARDGVEGRIVPERDPEALANAIEEIIENRALRGKFAQAARERAQEFTWENYGERLVNSLQQR